MPSAVAEDDTVNFDQEIDLLERDFQSCGDAAGSVAFAIHAESLRPFTKIQTGAGGRRNGAGGLRLALKIRKFRGLIVQSFLQNGGGRLQLFQERPCSFVRQLRYCPGRSEENT